MNPPSAASGQAGDSFWLQLALDVDVHTLAGAPATAWLGLQVDPAGIINMTLILLNKTSTRLPEAGLLHFNAAGNWSMQKLGRPINPGSVVTGGGINMHVVDSVSSLQDGGHQLVIESPDSGLVRWGQPFALPTPMTHPPDLQLGGSFVLFDNTWGTNYIMWYPFDSDDANIKYEYVIRLMGPT